MHSSALSARTLYAADKPLFQVLDNMNPGTARLRGITMVIHHSHRAQLLASPLQHPLIFVFPGCIVWLNLSSKQQVVLCILMTCGRAIRHTRKVSHQPTCVTTLKSLQSKEFTKQPLLMLWLYTGKTLKS